MGLLFALFDYRYGSQDDSQDEILDDGLATALSDLYRDCRGYLAHLVDLAGLVDPLGLVLLDPVDLVGP